MSVEEPVHDPAEALTVLWQEGGYVDQLIDLLGIVSMLRGDNHARHRMADERDFSGMAIDSIYNGAFVVFHADALAIAQGQHRARAG